MKGRKRKVNQFLVLAMLLYGKHASVKWTGPRSCSIKSNVFGRAIGMTTTRLRQHLEWLKRFRYLTELDIQHAVITCTITDPHDRTVTTTEGEENVQPI